MQKAASFRFERNYGNYEGRPCENCVVTAYDAQGEELWTRRSDDYDVTELDRCGEVGLASYGYLYVEGGSVVCLDPKTGEEIWRNAEFRGAGATSCFDQKERLCLSGFYGPELFIVDRDGKTCADMTKVVPDDSYFWTTIAGFEDGRIVLEYEAGNEERGATVLVDPESLEYVMK